MSQKKQKQPVALIVLDGIAHNPSDEMNAVVTAKTPTLDRIIKEYPCTELRTDGEFVGLPKGQMGNSEVGHLTIGAGRVVKQVLTRINDVIENNELKSNSVLSELFSTISSKEDSALHLLGIVGHGGVHGFQKHLCSIIQTAKDSGVKQIFIHAITDGRDRPPTASTEELKGLVDFIESVNDDDCSVHLATVIGRYYAMDRDKRWERTRRAYDLYTLGKGEPFPTALEGINAQHARGTTDEFLEPIMLDYSSMKREPTIKDGDALLFCNFRTDRMRQIVAAFLNKEGEESFKKEIEPKLSSLCTLTEYREDFNVPIVFPPEEVKNYFGEIVSQKGLKQLRISETEKYPHVTFFFNGQLETPYEGEERILVQSPKDVPTYDYKPEMSAYEVTEKLITALETKEFDVAIINYANCDMVGHTGNFEAVVKAVEVVDECLAKVLTCIENLGGIAIVTADHGNADQLIDYSTKEPHTYHTTHPVWCVLLGEKYKDAKLKSGGSLCDLAPTLLEILEIQKPEEMTGQSLIS